jgi:hypothetical protein
LAAWVAVVSTVLAIGYIAVLAPRDVTAGGSGATSAHGAAGAISGREIPAPSGAAVETGRVQISTRAAVRNVSLVWFAPLAAAALAGALMGRRIRGPGAVLEQAIRSQSERSSPAPGRRAPPLLAA